MDTEEMTAHNDAQTAERKPIKRRASEAVPKPADVDTTNEQLKKRHGKTGRAKSRSGHDFGKAESRQNRGNTQRHVVHDETRQQYTCQEFIIQGLCRIQSAPLLQVSPNRPLKKMGENSYKK